MLKLKKILPIEKIDTVDLVNRRDILDAKLLYTSMSLDDINEAETEIAEINQYLWAEPIAA